MNINLERLLDSLKMDALKNIRRNLNLKNMSSLRKKELVAALAEKIPASVPEKVQMMDLHQYTAIVAMMTKSGIMPIEQIGLKMYSTYQASDISTHPKWKTTGSRNADGSNETILQLKSKRNHDCR